MGRPAEEEPDIAVFAFQSVLFTIALEAALFFDKLDELAVDVIRFRDGSVYVW